MSSIAELEAELGTKTENLNVDRRTALVDFSYENPQTKEDFFTKQGITLPPHLKQAIAKRRLDYLAGRYCARLALKNLGFSTTEYMITTGPSRAPQWPTGYLGAITHTKSYAAAIVGKKSDWLGLGLDAEVIVDESKPSLVRHVCRPEEFEKLQGLDLFSDQVLFTLIFSAKESLFKALYPTVQNYFGFQAAHIIKIDQESGHFIIELAEKIHPDITAPTSFNGRFIQLNDKVVTLIKIKSDCEATIQISH
ncbi:MAG: 4'-phosphopantetheinyl transferase family protein [Oligoflexus sp.]